MNERTKIIYTLDLRLALLKRGFEPVFEIPNPKKPEFMAWVYERTPEFDAAFYELYGAKRGGNRSE